MHTRIPQYLKWYKNIWENIHLCNTSMICSSMRFSGTHDVHGELDGWSDAGEKLESQTEKLEDLIYKIN